MTSFVELLMEYIEVVDLDEREFRKEAHLSRATLARWKSDQISRPNCERVRQCAQLFQQHAQKLCQQTPDYKISTDVSVIQNMFKQLQTSIENLEHSSPLKKSQLKMVKALSEKVGKFNPCTKEAGWKAQVLRMKARCLQLEAENCATKEGAQLKKTEARSLKALALQFDPINPGRLLALAGCINREEFSSPPSVFLYENQEGTSAFSLLTSRPILHPAQFFGHESLLKKIFEGWNHTTLENVAMVGPKLSGKTSILNYLRFIQTIDSHTLRKEQRIPSLKQSFKWILVDFKNDLRTRQLHKLLKYFSDMLGFSKVVDLEYFIENIEDQIQTPTIFLMDNIDYALKHYEELGEDFWNCMRYLGSHAAKGKIGFCITSRQPFEELIEIDKTSHFINLFNEFDLNPFDEQDARSLINAMSKNWSEEEIQWILRESQAWPALLQILCKVRMEGGENWKEKGLKYLHKKLYQDLLCYSKQLKAVG